jgi:hypothetical protein
LGVANKAKIISVRIVGCDPTTTTTAATVQQYINDTRNRIIANRPRSAIVNFSAALVNPPATLDTALSQLMAANVPVIAASGQFWGNLPSTVSTSYTAYFPQRVSDVIRVGMSDNFDRKYDVATFPNGVGTLLGGILPQANHYNNSSIFAPAGPRMSGQFGNVAETLGVS